MYSKIRKCFLSIGSFFIFFLVSKVQVFATQTSEILTKNQVLIDLTTVSDMQNRNILLVCLSLLIVVVLILFISLNIYLIEKDKEDLEYSHYED